MNERAEAFRRRLQEPQPVLLDGAVGSELERRGVDTSLPLWSARALIEAPDVLEQIHREHIAAGAELVTTNTFRTHARSLIDAGYADRAGELTVLAVEIARRASDGRPDVWVAGSISPLEDCYSPDLVPDDESLRDEHAAMARDLAAGGADLILVETMNTIREVEAAARAAVATGLPVIASVVCGRDGKMLSGEAPAMAAKVLESVGVDGLSVNCAGAPDLIHSLQRLLDATSLPTAAYGNVGHVDHEVGWVNTDAVDPQAYARHAATWLDAGARMVGSCCGTTPDHTRALRELIDTRSGEAGGG